MQFSLTTTNFSVLSSNAPNIGGKGKKKVVKPVVLKRGGGGGAATGNGDVY